MSEEPKTVASIADPGSFTPEDLDLRTGDPLGFDGYHDALTTARERSGSDESVQAGPATIGSMEIELATFDFDFLGGSMGEVAGERMARAMERAAARGVPFILRTSTGGARMQEGMRALVQMPKVVAARLALAESHQPFVAVLGHPSTGGVLASVAALADVTIAEAEATIGFAGPRVAERLSGTPLPPGSHTANSAYTHGLVDELVPAADAHAFVVSVLKVLAPDEPEDVDVPIPVEAAVVEDAWDAVEAARSPTRPIATELVVDCSELLVELRGDKRGSDDPAVMTALARTAGHRVMWIATDRRLSPGPAGYAKARRCVEIAGRLRIPIVSLVDMRGADPTAPSEAAGIAWEIASMFATMLRCPSPVVAIVTGEGGSGGALAFAAGNELIAFHDSIFSVIAPEGAAEILWRAVTRAPDAARALRLTARDLEEMGIADWVVDARLDPDAIRFVMTEGLGHLNDPEVQDWSVARRRRWRS